MHTILHREGLVGEQGRRRRLALQPFERPVSNDLWQIDATQLVLADGFEAWVVDVLDDHARFVIATKSAGLSPATVAEVAECDRVRELSGPARRLNLSIRGGDDGTA